MKKKKISGKLIFNILVIGLCLFMIFYFFYSENGLNDLLHSSLQISAFWIVAAIGFQLLYMFIEALIIYYFIHTDNRSFTFIDAIKVSSLGLFWCAVTPSSTGGQPMQIYLLHSMGIDIGYATSRLVQKFLIYQIVLTSISVLAFIYKINFFMNALTSPLIIPFVIVGFGTQLLITGALILISFKPKVTKKLIFFFTKILGKIKIIKDVDKKTANIQKQLDVFHSSNSSLYKHKKTMGVTAILTFLQFIAMFTVPYCIYRSFGFAEATPLDMISSQAFVNLVSGMIPIPGASGAAELGFTAFFNNFFTPETLKSATLIWRMINYYGVVLITAPFAYITNGKTRNGKIEHVMNSKESLDEIEKTTDENQADEDTLSDNKNQEDNIVEENVSANNG